MAFASVAGLRYGAEGRSGKVAAVYLGIVFTAVGLVIGIPLAILEEYFI